MTDRPNAEHAERAREVLLEAWGDQDDILTALHFSGLVVEEAATVEGLRAENERLRGLVQREGYHLVKEGHVVLVGYDNVPFVRRVRKVGGHAEEVHGYPVWRTDWLDPDPDACPLLSETLGAQGDE
jgi:hypothetical protein